MSSSIQISDERIEVSQFPMAITWARDESPNWGGANMRASCVAVISGTRFSSYRNYRWEILVTFWPTNGLRSDLRVPNFKNFPGGACPLAPIALSHLSGRNGRTTLK